MNIKYIKYVSAKQASPQIEAIYLQIKQDFGLLAEPFTLHSAIPDLLAAVWIATREICLINQQVSRTYIEAISTAISYSNSCKYCVDAHSIMLLSLNDKSVNKAIKTANFELIEDSKLKKISKWSLNNSNTDNEIFFNPPFSKKEAPEIIGTAFIFNYINRVVEIFLKKSPVSEKKIGKSFLMKIASLMFSRAVKKEKKAGDSFRFFSKIVKNDSDFEWANGDQRILKSLSFFKKICFDEVDKYISKKTKETILYIANNENKDIAGISSNWTNKFNENFDVKDLHLAKLMLLTIYTPYQITEKYINYLKNKNISDEALLATTSFASLSIAISIAKKQAKYLKM